MQDPDGPLSFLQVLAHELEEIRVSRRLRRAGKMRDSPAEDPITRAHRAQLLGLAFSGGGIRSATFNLGVLQALAATGLLRMVDYLSTVSGGGYIGSWLAAWIRRAGFDQVERDLVEVARDPRRGPDPVGFLRKYSNYLTPRLGFLSADTWTVAAVWVRNTLLNFAILTAALAAVLLAPRLLIDAGGLEIVAAWESHLALVSLALAVLFIALNLRALAAPRAERPPFYMRQTGIQCLIVAPAFLAAWLGSDRLWIFAQELSGFSDQVAASRVWIPCAATGLVFCVLAFALGMGGGFLQCYYREHFQTPYSLVQRLRPVGLVAVFAVISGAAAMGTSRGVIEILRNWTSNGAVWHLLSWGPPLMLVMFSVIAIVFIGLMGRTFPDDRREWLSRVGAWISIYLLIWSGMFGIVVYGPLLLAMAIHATGGWAGSGLGAGWMATTLAGLLAGNDSRTGDETDGHKQSSPWLGRLAKVTPFIFVVGLLLWISFAAHLLLAWISGASPTLLPGAKFLVDNHWALMNRPGTGLVAIAILTMLAVSVGFSLRVDINEFSMHHLYKNRLVRCYLGASNPRRRANPFTGFDFSDDVHLADLAPSGTSYQGPYPILNAALNLVHGEDLAWQERKAASFVFTPGYCGYNAWPHADDVKARHARLAREGFRPTPTFAYPGGGVHIGTAMAISGAAASPNMGYHSSAAVGFLLTMFNVRLGWWLGNPRHPQKWRRAGPRSGLAFLVAELLGLTDDDSDYVYLSDGGHFENLGVYELVRRRCRYIIACDSGEDRSLRFEDLGNAIRKCRADLGVDIEIDLDQVRHAHESGSSQWHCAIGTIHYEAVDNEGRPGTLVYIKSCLTGDEPTDVQEYAARNPEFPHQSTGDQWFDESQFESYRRLGRHAANSAIETAVASTGLTDRESLFVALRQQWYPPSPNVAASFTKHSQALDALFERLHEEPALKFLDAQIYPEWGELMRRADHPPENQYWLPRNADELRAGFYFCNSLIQLMEDVYLDLNLEADHSHPDNRGWMNLFRHWAWSGMFRVSWAISASSYGARFQSFCERQLGLSVLKTVEITEIKPGVDLIDAGLNFVEADILDQFRAHTEFAASPIYGFRITVENPVKSFPDSFVFGFTYGFALVHEKRVVCFRVQDHLRSMGLGRRALQAMIAQNLAFDVLPENELPEAVRNLWSGAERRRFERLFDSVWGATPGLALDTNA